MDLLSYQKGDILFSNCQTLVNPVSCDGTIDSYLSKRFFMRYPAMYTKYLQSVKRNNLLQVNYGCIKVRLRIYWIFPLKKSPILSPNQKWWKQVSWDWLKLIKIEIYPLSLFLDFSNPTYSTMEPKFKKSAIIFFPDYQSYCGIYRLYSTFKNTDTSYNKTCWRFEWRRKKVITERFCFEIK